MLLEKQFQMIQISKKASVVHHLMLLVILIDRYIQFDMFLQILIVSHGINNSYIHPSLDRSHFAP